MSAVEPRARAALVVAWAGGAVFAAALLYYLHFFFVRLGRPVAPEQAQALVSALGVNLVLFGTFAAHHSIMARTGAKRWLARRLPASLERTCYVWTSSALLVAVCALWWRVPGTVYVVAGPMAGLLTAVQVAGLALTLRAAAAIDVLELVGIRQVRGDERPPAFTVAGPFRLVRHPIYLGWLLVVFGAPVMTVDRLAWAVISSSYLVAAIPWEERSLREAFGDVYRQYQRDVRWRLIPGLY
jgi:protein-S-isoprenylcysteine O-methyltransferase Ste14